MRLDAKGLTYRQLNSKIHEIVKTGEKEIILDNVNGHRYIGDNMDDKIKIIINGIPGNDLAFVMDGPEIFINGNGQDAIANTMSSGKVVVNGNAGDICGYAMRGGKLYIKNNVGYRSGIHMKEFDEHYPTIVIGGRAGDFLGEYMAGGVIVVLGLHTDGKEVVGNFCGTGMHGGRIFVRGKVEQWKLGKEVKIKALEDKDKEELTQILADYSQDLNIDLTDKVKIDDFILLYPGSSRPYGRLYAY